MTDDLDPFEEQPLDDDERAAVQQDLVDVQALKRLLEPRGIKGAVFYCPDCSEDHYLAWDLLTNNLQQLLSQGESPIHEPAFDPDPDDYVGWDYARGFLDGYESFEDEELEEWREKLEAGAGDLGVPVGAIRKLLDRLEIDLRSGRGTDAAPAPEEGSS